MMKHRHTSEPVGQAVTAARGGLAAAFGFSCLVNLLILVGPLFMLQVYDRVLSSRSVPTLVALFGIVAVLYGFLGFFDFTRARVLSRLGHRLDARLSAVTLREWSLQSTGGNAPAGRPLSDLGVLRGFFGSPGMLAMLDIPWTPLYLLLVFYMHVQLGLLASFAALVAVSIAVLTEMLTRKPMAAAAVAEHRDTQFAEQVHRNVEPLRAMGMLGESVERWRELHDKAAAGSQRATDRVEWLSALSRAIRLLAQSAILALGAYLAIKQQISAGSIVAASIVSGRALGPIDQLIGSWRTLVRTRQAYARLTQHLHAAADPDERLDLPVPLGRVAVENATKLVPAPRAAGGRRTILDRIRFELRPGDGLGVIGPSACGKSTLARLLCGVWIPDMGSVRLDGATFDQWDADRVGRYVGYLPQSVELLAGTLAQNIARFTPDATDEEVVAAAQLAGVHDMILALTDGYSTRVAEGAVVLSGGQIQRIALARAVFRRPPLVVLDEPNSSLDAEGDQALTECIRTLRHAGSTVVVMAHRPSAIAAVDTILMLDAGRQLAFGPKTEILRKVTKVASA